jgi:hypothetical protein
MATATVIWATAAAVIITDGAADTVIIMAGHAVDITIVIKTRTGGRFLAASVRPNFAAGFDTLRLDRGSEDRSYQQR